MGLWGVEPVLITSISAKPLVIFSKDWGSVPDMQGLSAWGGISLRLRSCSQVKHDALHASGQADRYCAKTPAIPSPTSLSPGDFTHSCVCTWFMLSSNNSWTKFPEPIIKKAVFNNIRSFLHISVAHWSSRGALHSKYDSRAESLILFRLNVS